MATSIESGERRLILVCLGPSSLRSAPTLTPADYAPIWAKVLDAFAATWARRGLSVNDRRHRMAHYMDLFILDVLYRRRVPESGPGRVIDRRGVAA